MGHCRSDIFVVVVGPIDGHDDRVGSIGAIVEGAEQYLKLYYIFACLNEFIIVSVMWNGLDIIVISPDQLNQPQ